ncbi:MAG: hypothetical protein IPP74_08285 [Alphaproteobacteria bacterium]|nr:hypothetical protein [Alphaproteobacteria bacterium]
MMMVIATISTVVLGVILIGFQISLTKENLQQELLILAKVIGERSSPILQIASNMESLNLDKEVLVVEKNKASENLSALKRKEVIRAACLYTKDGKLFADFKIDPNLMCSIIEGQQEEVIYSLNHVKVQEPIYGKSKQWVGFIVIYASLDEMYSQIINWLMVGFLSLIITLVLSYVLVNKLHGKITQPIENLKNTATDIISHHNYKIRIASSYANYDETQAMVNSFNNMLDQIEIRDKALWEMNQSLEQKVHERTEDLEYALKVKEDFLSNMSHEIRTPIHGVLSFVRLLVEEWTIADDALLFNYAQRAHKSSERLLILINNLLDMSKFEKGAIQLERKEVRFSDVIQTVIAETSGLVEAKNEHLVFEPMANEPMVEVDEGRMAQVITNLIGNAAKYSQKGTIRISQRVDREAIFLDGLAQAPGMLISVVDEGIGIPADELVKIFDKFFESSLTKSKAGGTGLGLAISREIVKAHLGSIWAENNKNGPGSTFTFVFPLKEIPGVTQISDKYV